MHLVVVIFALRRAFSTVEEFGVLVMGLVNGKVAELPKLVSEFW